METIKIILEKCQKLWDDLIVFKTSLDNLSVSFNAQKEAQDKTQEKFEGWQNDLTEREVETGKIESVVNLNEENKSLAHEISQAKEKLAEEKRIYNEHVTKENYSLKEQRTLLSQDEKTLKEGQEKLKIDIEQYEKDRKEFKKKVIEKIAEKIT